MAIRCPDSPGFIPTAGRSPAKPHAVIPPEQSNRLACLVLHLRQQKAPVLRCFAALLAGPLTCCAAGYGPRCKCMELPALASMGLAMNTALSPCFSAISRAAYLNKKAWSATATASPCSRLISYCVAPARAAPDRHWVRSGRTRSLAPPPAAAPGLCIGPARFSGCCAGRTGTSCRQVPGGHGWLPRGTLWPGRCAIRHLPESFRRASACRAGSLKCRGICTPHLGHHVR